VPDADVTHFEKLIYESTVSISQTFIAI
jgi:hypothetical protein